MEFEIGAKEELDWTEKERPRSELRLQYEAQGRVIRDQIGGLEGIRSRLGLSQRKMTQLLLVDPSAWTRWIRDEDRVPPHIWRSLQWYEALQGKIPGLSAEYFLGRDLKQIDARFEDLRKTELAKLEGKIQEQTLPVIEDLKKQLKMQRFLAIFNLFLMLAGWGCVGWLLFLK